MQIYANHVIHGLLKVKERQHTMLNLQGTIYVTVHFQPLLAEPTEFGDFTQLGQVKSFLKILRPREIWRFPWREPIQGFIFNFDIVHRTIFLSVRITFTLLLKSTFTASAGRLFHLKIINPYDITLQLADYSTWIFGLNVFFVWIKVFKWVLWSFSFFLQSRASLLSLNPCNFFCKR